MYLQYGINDQARWLVSGHNLVCLDGLRQVVLVGDSIRLKFEDGTGASMKCTERDWARVVYPAIFGELESRRACDD